MSVSDIRGSAMVASASPREPISHAAVRSSKELTSGGFFHFDAPLWRLGGRKNVVHCSVVGQRWAVALVADTNSSVLINMFHSREDRLHKARPERRPHHDDQHLHGRTRFFPNSSEFALFNPNENFVDSESAPFQRLSLSIGRFSGACTENASPSLAAKNPSGSRRRWSLGYKR